MQRPAAGVPSRALATCRQAMRVEEKGVVSLKEKQEERSKMTGLFTDLLCIAKTSIIRRFLFAALLRRCRRLQLR